MSRLRLYHNVRSFCQSNDKTQLVNKIPKLHNNTNLSQQSRSFITRRSKGVNKLESNVKLRNTDPNQSDKISQLIRPLGFTVLTCTASFSGAMIWQYENLRYHANRLRNKIDKQKQAFRENFKNFGFRSHVNDIWNHMSPGQKMTLSIIGGNFAVFLLWKVPALQSHLLKYFTCTTGKPALSMLLCTFSHFSFFHIAANMYVLWSFSSVAVGLFGKEQFIAVFLSGGTIASFASVVHKLVRGRMVPSVGASGALMAILGAVCYTYPNARLSIAFIGDLIPHSFSADSAMKGIILLDIMGLVLGWKMFDHAAHLGGMLFGLWYVHYGRDLIWGNREHVMRIWHDIRGKP